MSENVRLIGVRLLGMALAERLLKQGFSVAGYDIDSEGLDALAVAGGKTCRDAGEVQSFAQSATLQKRARENHPGGTSLCRGAVSVTPSAPWLCGIRFLKHFRVLQIPVRWDVQDADHQNSIGIGSSNEGL